MIGANKDGLFQENLINSLDYNQGNVLVVIVAVNVTEAETTLYTSATNTSCQDKYIFTSR